MAQKAPYTFPARTRAAMSAYILDRATRSYNYATYSFCWNVKAYEFDFDGPTLRAAGLEGYALDSDFDSQWAEWLESFDDPHGMFCEDAGRTFTENEWCSYPGDDQGDWVFSFAGRSGGWLVLTEWRGRDVRHVDSDDLESWDFADLRAFYRGLICADSDITSDKAGKEVLHMAAAQYESQIDEWADNRTADAAALALSLESARPDLYGA